MMANRQPATIYIPRKDNMYNSKNRKSGRPGAIKQTQHAQDRIDAALRGDLFYLGPVCKNGHDDGGGSRRDVEGNLCQRCIKSRSERNKEQGI